MCTTMIITKGATVDGSMIVTHSDDNELADQRIVYVPAQDHPAGAIRQVFKELYRYPRIVTAERGPGYDTAGFNPTEPIGYIPQVEHTYAYYDGCYGIMNEYNLMMGECTDGAKYQPEPVTLEEAEQKGVHMRLFYSQELSHIALERCKKAREAIALMGELIEQYGYYSTGETLLVADEDEAWVFEMCALNDEQFHSVWVAQRIPDGEVFVAANEFRIREIKPNHPDFMYSKFLYPGLEKIGWWKPADGPIDWLKTVSYGEYNHPYYSLRRVWRILDRVNPDLCLSPWANDSYTTDYPFSIKPNRKLSLRKIFSLYRDHYEGTQFDLSQGVAAGPYNDPNRYLGPYDGNQNNISDSNREFYGAWERAISIFYQGYTYAAQVRPSAPEATKGLIWIGPDVSYTTCFVPFSSKISPPWTYQSGSPQKLDRTSAWWAFDFVANWSRLNYKRMTQVDVIPLQQEIEDDEFGLVRAWDAACKDKSHDEALNYIAKACNDNAANVLSQWWDLADLLVAKYSDGYMNLENQTAAKDIGYSSTWLSYTNYKDGPTTYKMKL